MPKKCAGASQQFTLLPHSVEGPVPAFHPGVMLAACSPCGDKGKPDVLCAKAAAPAPRVPWKPSPACSHSALVGRQHHGTKCHSWPLYRLMQTNPLRGHPNELAATGLDGLQTGCSWKLTEISPYTSASKHQIQFPSIKRFFPLFNHCLCCWSTDLTGLFDKLQNLNPSL